MGTRADFYVGIDPATMEYLGSIAWDGYDIGDVAGSSSEEDYRARVEAFLESRDDGSFPERDGWPWPWEDSGLTDEVYTWANGKILCDQGGEVGSGGRWVQFPVEYEDPEAYEDEKRLAGYSSAPKASYPNMKDIQRVTLGSRSGVTVLAVQGDRKSSKPPT